MSLQMDELLRLALSQFWQVSLLILAAGLLVRIFCRRRPYLAYVVWLLVIAKCLMPPVWSSPTSLFSWSEAEFLGPPIAHDTGASMPLDTAGSSVRRIASHVEPAGLAAEANEPSADQRGQLNAVDSAGLGLAQPAWPLGVAHVLAAAWLCGAVVLAGVIMARAALAGVLLRRASVPTEHDLAKLVGELSRRLGIRRKVRLMVTSRPFGPGVCGLLRPKLVLPQVVVSECSLNDLERIIAHELIHIRRGDNTIAAFQLVAQIIWWFHPLVWWANRRACRERERCCDEAVVASLGCDPGRYAQTLLDVLRRRRDTRPALFGSGIRSSQVTSRRMESIMDTRRVFHRRMPGVCWTVFAMGVLLVVPGRALTRPGETSESTSQAEAEPTEAAVTQAKTDAENPELGRSAKNLREIMSAIHMYHDVANHLPPPHSGFGFDGKTNEWFRHRPYLSWRVLLLPLLGEKELFGKFRLGEPWDSEHNKKLIPLLPKIYCAPGSKAGEGKTNYLGVVGPNAAFPEKETITVIDFFDGTSDTIMLVEAPDEAAVEWTRPKDFPVGTREPAKILTGLREGGFLTAFADGAPQFVSNDITSDTLQRLLIRNDREPVPYDEVRRSVRFVSPAGNPNANDK